MAHKETKREFLDERKQDSKQKHDSKRETSLGLTAKKEGDMSTWYTEVIQKADLADYSSVSGCIILKPYAYAIWEKIQHAVDTRLKAMGVKNAYFPLFIPEKLLRKEQAHVKGFSPEVAWVTEAGGSKLDERLAIRPTSETIMYESYAKWIRSWRDLPLKLNQWNNVVRWEFKHPVPFLRTREFLWNEGHTCFATKDEAEKECVQILNMYSHILENYFALAGVKGKKTENEKFAGAEYTLSIELYLPNGKAIQGPDAHHDGQNFAKAFGISFLDKNEKEQFVYQNTWAITTRMIGVMIMAHGDDKGLVLPPMLAPLQVVIVPIIFKDSKEKVMEKAHEIAQILSLSKAASAYLDDREEYNPGWKFNHYELTGVPIRIEIGPRDVEKGQVIAVRRDTLMKETIAIKDLPKRIPELLVDIQSCLYKRSLKNLQENIEEVKTLDGLKQAVEKKKLALAFFCGSTSCEDRIKAESNGATARNIPFDQKLAKGKCAGCGKESTVQVLWGKSY
ncbi:proline--tRNA ligase [Candidatus Woesearchaeota archaeon]|nr:proline--tRNA ligase [Candidatus Woesearchaeota archaeon]